jgi:undecaprenyl diphosphate synthase
MSDKTPTCIGIILDGNRRWAKEKNLPTLEGHRKGMDKLVDTVRWVRDRGTKHLVVYAFSTENWNRSEEEVSYLMNMVKEAAEKELSKLSEENVRVRFVGQRDRLDLTVRKAVEKTEEESKNNTALTLWVCLSYGGRPEIVNAAKSISESGEEITEESFKKHLWTAGMPDPDIIVRTGGEKRLSNFLLWQGAYAEIFFVDPYWPDFSEKILEAILIEFGARERRHGK